ncbi:hypothetical protein ANCCAN_21495 [Ancylostoma caninum]|uniref:Uncharacterized protein n=1 Tax=Ancylostoma caninum TaxID=29170 RepID=A0A368FPC5_ANCCA|nr:hypothetical protein ANCCAN_21495 [Ancylostoma caninum]
MTNGMMSRYPMKMRMTDDEEEEEEEPVRSSRTRAKRRVRLSSEESETVACSQPNNRTANGRYSTRSGNVSKRRRIESESEQEASPRRNRSSRRNVTAISYAESDEDSAPDFPEVSSRGRVRKPRRVQY